jgi:hypothetical protein
MCWALCYAIWVCCRCCNPPSFSSASWQRWRASVYPVQTLLPVCYRTFRSSSQTMHCNSQPRPRCPCLNTALLLQPAFNLQRCLSGSSIVWPSASPLLLTRSVPYLAGACGDIFQEHVGPSSRSMWGHFPGACGGIFQERVGASSRSMWVHLPGACGGIFQEHVGVTPGRLAQ